MSRDIRQTTNMTKGTRRKIAHQNLDVGDHRPNVRTICRLRKNSLDNTETVQSEDGLLKTFLTRESDDASKR